MSYRIVQPWGKDRAEEATTISQHPTAAVAFAAIAALRAQMARTGAPTDAVELVVFDPEGVAVEEPEGS